VSATIIDGKALGAKVREEVAASVAGLGHVGLATVLVGHDPASHIYIDLKQKAAQQAGMEARDLKLPEDTSEEELLALPAPWMYAPAERRGRLAWFTGATLVAGALAVRAYMTAT